MTQDIQADTQKSERIAKRIARAGLCSRREAERWIGQGRVYVNGQVLESAAYTVTDSDLVEVDGKSLPQKEKTQLYLFHKPAGLVTSESDEQGRKTVFDALPKNLPRLISIGRLDLNTEGLLLLTNDGELSRYLELPETGLQRTYRVRVFGNVGAADFDRLRKGLTYEGIKYRPIDIAFDSNQPEEGTVQNCWLRVTLHEGKNREVRKAMEAVGLQVNRLMRLSYGPFNLGSLETGSVQKIDDQVLQRKLPGYFKT